MARRKVTIQRSLGAKGVARQEKSSSAIDELAESMSTSDTGFRPTDQRVYEIDLSRIMPDSAQPSSSLTTLWHSH